MLPTDITGINLKLLMRNSNMTSHDDESKTGKDRIYYEFNRYDRQALAYNQYDKIINHTILHHNTIHHKIINLIIINHNIINYNIINIQLSLIQ